MLVIENPLGFKILDNSNLRKDFGTHQLRPKFLELAPFLFEILEARAGDVVMIEHAIPVFLRAAPRRPPPKMQQPISPVRDRLYYPQARLAGPRCPEEVGLAGRSG